MHRKHNGGLAGHITTSRIPQTKEHFEALLLFTADRRIIILRRISSRAWFPLSLVKFSSKAVSARDFPNNNCEKRENRYGDAAVEEEGGRYVWEGRPPGPLTTVSCTICTRDNIPRSVGCTRGRIRFSGSAFKSKGFISRASRTASSCRSFGCIKLLRFWLTISRIRL